MNRRQRIKIRLESAKYKTRGKREKIKKKVQKAKTNIKEKKEKVKAKTRKAKEKIKEKLIKPIVPADILTMSNAICGLLSIFLSIEKHFFAAAILILIAVVFDFFDGFVARKTKKESELGIELDSLADIISFGVAPAVFGFSQSNGILSIIIYSIFICCGVFRLAKFNIQIIRNMYVGMPITINGIIFPLLYFIKIDPKFWVFAYAISAILMVFPIKIKKKWQ